jgi:fermentation-respiration switch protein FrsA (DUF1100 family)
MRQIRSDGLNADLFFKADDAPRPALVLLGGSEGGKSWSRHTEAISRFIGLGYVVLSLAYFGAEGLPATLRAVPVEYIKQALDWLSHQKEVLPNGYVLMGASRGAELALLAGSLFTEIKAVAAIAPSCVVFPGPPLGLGDILGGQHSAWSLEGRETAFVPVPYTWTTLQGMVSGRRTRMFEEALLNRDAVSRAAIAVEKIKGPILIESFLRDQIWPSTSMSNQIIDRLKDKGFAYPFKHSAHDSTHSDWSFEPCWKDILEFLKEHSGTR